MEELVSTKKMQKDISQAIMVSNPADNTISTNPAALVTQLVWYTFIMSISLGYNCINYDAYIIGYIYAFIYMPIYKVTGKFMSVCKCTYINMSYWAFNNLFSLWQEKYKKQLVEMSNLVRGMEVQLLSTSISIISQFYFHSIHSLKWAM